MTEDRMRHQFADYLSKAEVAIYSIVAVVVVLTALVTIASSAKILWDGLSHWSLAAQTIRALNELLIVLMLVEILHTVRISIRSHILVVTEPFLVVGLIACIRRILVITLEAATLTKEGSWSTAGAVSILHASMIELGLLGFLILIFVYCIALLRRHPPHPEGLRDV
jgi:uncharacterized membrane protein (DUF373 family)